MPILAAKVLAGVTSVAILLTSWATGYANLQNRVVSLETQLEEQIELLGGVTFVGTNKHRLATGISSAGTSLVLQSFTTPDGRELTMTDFGDTGFGTLDPNTTRKEFIRFTAVSQDSGSTRATLTVTRGHDFISPFAASSTLGQSHAAGSVFILSNDPGQQSQLANKNNQEDIIGQWIFDDALPPGFDGTTDCTTATSICSRGFIVAQANASTAAEATFGARGTAELGSNLELQSGTQSGSDAVLIVPVEFLSVTSTATITVPVTDSAGKLDQAFLDLTEVFIFANNVTVTGTLAVTGTTTITGAFIANGAVSGTGLSNVLFASTTDFAATGTDATQLNFFEVRIPTSTIDSNDGFRIKTWFDDLDTTAIIYDIDLQIDSGRRSRIALPSATRANEFGFVEWTVVMDASTTQADIYGVAEVQNTSSNFASSTKQYDNVTTTDLSQSFLIRISTNPGAGDSHINFLGIIIERLRQE